MATITRNVYEPKVDVDGNQIFDEKGNAVLEFVRTETVEEPDVSAEEWEKQNNKSNELPNQ